MLTLGKLKLQEIDPIKVIEFKRAMETVVIPQIKEDIKRNQHNRKKLK